MKRWNEGRGGWERERGKEGGKEEEGEREARVGEIAAGGRETSSTIPIQPQDNHQ